MGLVLSRALLVVVPPPLLLLFGSPPPSDPPTSRRTRSRCFAAASRHVASGISSKEGGGDAAPDAAACGEGDMAENDASGAGCRKRRRRGRAFICVRLFAKIEWKDTSKRYWEWICVF